ncbi:hypothetical protein U1769_04895 [Sphingomonas sp. ZT3P38]
MAKADILFGACAQSGRPINLRRAAARKPLDKFATLQAAGARALVDPHWT